MVTRDPELRGSGSSDYVGSSEGAPPLPPPGGYRGASRVAQVTAARAGTVETATLAKPKRRSHWSGIAAIIAASVFAVALLGILAFGALRNVYSTGALVVQALVVAAVIAALVIPRGRKLGIIALSITLLVNVATVGGAGSLMLSQSGDYRVEKSPVERHAQGFPGVEDLTEQEVLNAPSLEEHRAESERILTELRERLSADFGVTWVRTAAEIARPERNGRGGESMLQSVSFDGWTTNEPIHDNDTKRAMLDAIDNELSDLGYISPVRFNEDTTAMPEAQMAHVYGSADPEQQAIWEWGSISYYGYELYIRGVFVDLSHDADGSFRSAAEAQQQNAGDPIEGLTLSASASSMLAEGDVAEFKERMKSY